MVYETLACLVGVVFLVGMVEIFIQLNLVYDFAMT